MKFGVVDVLKLMTVEVELIMAAFSFPVLISPLEVILGL